MFCQKHFWFGTGHGSPSFGVALGHPAVGAPPLPLLPPLPPPLVAEGLEVPPLPPLPVVDDLDDLEVVLLSPPLLSAQPYPTKSTRMETAGSTKRSRPEIRAHETPVGEPDGPPGREVITPWSGAPAS